MGEIYALIKDNSIQDTSKNDLFESYILNDLDLPRFNPEPKKRRTNITRNSFRESPSITPLDDLASFAIMGIDVKITPEGEVKIIEINGLNSGMKGFQRAKVEYDPNDNTNKENFMQNLLTSIRDELKSKYDSSNPCEDALIRRLKSYGERQVAYIGSELLLNGQSDSRFEGADVLFEDDDFFSNKYFSFDEIHPCWKTQYGEIAATLVDIEKTLSNKGETDKLLEDLREYKPRSYDYTEDGLDKLVEEENPNYVVIKPKEGARGDGVSIVRLDQLNQEELPYNLNYVVEPFIESKPIHSFETGEEHDGCMRYVVLVEERKTGEINISHFGGYWRLSPRPINEYGNLEAMRGNLAQGAYSERLSSEEKELVKGAINDFLPQFYQRMVENCGSRKIDNFMKLAKIVLR